MVLKSQCNGKVPLNMEANNSIPSKKIRVMIVDDHDIVRRGLELFLGVFDDLEFVGEAANGEAAVKLCSQVLPDVVLMDMVMPVMDGATATRIIRQQFPNVQVVGLTSFKDEQYVLKALNAGAIGYLLKDVLANELAQAIRSAHAGRFSLSKQAAEALVEATNHSPTNIPTLTKREFEVLSLMIEGVNNKDIAKRLCVSTTTVKSHVSNILSKLDVLNRTEAVTKAVRLRMISYD
jgi:two-component system, NarL family, response regulator LiaR